MGSSRNQWNLLPKNQYKICSHNPSQRIKWSLALQSHSHVHGSPISAHSLTKYSFSVFQPKPCIPQSKDHHQPSNPSAINSLSQLSTFSNQINPFAVPPKLSIRTSQHNGAPAKVTPYTHNQPICLKMVFTKSLPKISQLPNTLTIIISFFDCPILTDFILHFLKLKI